MSPQQSVNTLVSNIVLNVFFSPFTVDANLSIKCVELSGSISGDPPAISACFYCHSHQEGRL
jgi:hypothetical protein